MDPPAPIPCPPGLSGQGEPDPGTESGAAENGTDIPRDLIAAHADELGGNVQHQRGVELPAMCGTGGILEKALEIECEDVDRENAGAARAQGGESLLVGVVAGNAEPKCPRCGGARLSKLISRFAVARSEDELLDEMADPSRLGDMDDPREMAGLRQDG